MTRVGSAMLGLCIALSIRTATAAAITVALPGNPGITESFAADELGTYLQTVTGRKVRLWPDFPAWGELAQWRKLGGPVFIVGNTRFSQEFKKRCEVAGPEAYCLHSEGNVLRQVRQFFDANPAYSTFGVVPIDGGSWCECDNCRALDRPPGGHAGRVIALANQVAEAIHDKHPDKELLVLAYADRYLQCPEGLPLHPNV